MKLLELFVNIIFKNFGKEQKWEVHALPYSNMILTNSLMRISVESRRSSSKMHYDFGGAGDVERCVKKTQNSEQMSKEELMMNKRVWVLMESDTLAG